VEQRQMPGKCCARFVSSSNGIIQELDGVGQAGDAVVDIALIVSNRIEAGVQVTLKDIEPPVYLAGIISERIEASMEVTLHRIVMAYMFDDDIEAGVQALLYCDHLRHDGIELRGGFLLASEQIVKEAESPAIKITLLCEQRRQHTQQYTPGQAADDVALRRDIVQMPHLLKLLDRVLVFLLHNCCFSWSLGLHCGGRCWR
jgi:hypothetical protein